MNESSLPPASELATGLLDALPRLLRMLRADIPLSEDNIHSDEEDSVWHDVLELRASSGQMTLLRLLLKNDRCNMQELARHLAVTPPTVTMMVKRLLTQGYVERQRDERDWRLVWVKATARGKRAVLWYDQARLASLQQRLAQLDAEERFHLQIALPALFHLIEVDL